ncbi:hypothetical protein BS78_09G105300 [Paspalum vaginatum]|nr:hypothetical protein BS78_09G105300 [Paspalum vaginatum]
MASHLAALAPVLLSMVLLAPPPPSMSAAAAARDTLPRKSSLAVEENGTQILRSSPDGTFSCGFHNIYEGAFTFSTWYTDDPSTVVWSANRGRPVHAWGAAVTLRKDGAMVLTDYDGTVVWQSHYNFIPDVQYAQLLDTGNLVLKNSSNGTVWQSFDSPTDTVLPTQRISDASKLVSTTELQLPGHYIFRFSDQSMLSLIYDDTNLTSVYWPDPDFQYYENRRNLDNSTRIASLGDSGDIFSSDFADNHSLSASDRGAGVKRRLKLDRDGNLRLYSFNSSDKAWSVSWIAESQPCMTHGLCGPYGVCHYSPQPTCSCPPGYQMKNPGNWTQGCLPIVDIPCDGEQNVKFLELLNTDFWGSDQQRIEKVPWETCRNACASDCSCKGFQYQRGNGTCYPKSFLFNGRSFPTPTVRTMYIKLPLSFDTSKLPVPQSNVLDPVPHHLQCGPARTISMEQDPSYLQKPSQEEPKWFYFYGFIGAFFVIEVFFFTFAWFFVLRRELRSSEVWAAEEGYKVMADHFRMYSHRELVKATENFTHELGWGGTGVAYKGILDDDRVVVVKKLENIRRSREEFHDELHVIARINHMNLVRIYGFCSERSHRMLVLEYAEKGSLADVLFKKSKTSLGWKQRFNIALGVAKGLAYLHHECLEWIIHCNLKPENILLDQDLEPKITDFGLAKLLSRSGPTQNDTRARGTVGYIAPEWISGLPITAKADVYSYGVVLLELVSGTRVFDLVKGEDEKVHVMLKKFIMMLSYRLEGREPFWIAEFVDFRLGGEFDYLQAKVLIKLAVSCLEEERKKRPTMESVVESLLSVDFAGNR